MTTNDDLWPAPAKLNLFLHITGRRPDGYHDLQTIFSFIDFKDELSFGIRSDGQIIRNKPIENVPVESDLCFKAATLLKQESNCPLGAEIGLQKRIPMGAGLGGGSSDAATTLVALNHLWELNLPKEKLMLLAAQLGADVPVFVFGKNAWAEGTGDKLEAVDLPEVWYVVIFPGVTVPTGRLFEDPELTRDARPIKIRDYFAGGTLNVFESGVRKKFPPVNNAIDWLSHQDIKPIGTPLMTGTGSSVFAAYADEASARSVALNAEKFSGSVGEKGAEDWQVIVSKSCNESALARKLKTVAGNN